MVSRWIHWCFSRPNQITSLIHYVNVWTPNFPNKFSVKLIFKIWCTICSYVYINWDIIKRTLRFINEQYLTNIVFLSLITCVIISKSGGMYASSSAAVAVPPSDDELWPSPKRHLWDNSSCTLYIARRLNTEKEM